MPGEIRIGPFAISGAALLAPMSGITDAPFRKLCLNSGASLTTSEMTTADLSLWNSAKSRRRLDFRDVGGIRVVQIAGSEPEQMRAAARAATRLGAQIIDINLGCPAKKVCRKLAGSALLKDEDLVRRILVSVVDAVDVPVTVKMRTGWSPEHRNGIKVARLAEQAGVMALSVHGRTRACAFGGEAEYETIKAIKSAVKIPVFANGDIDTPEKAARVMELTGADGVMIGRGANGRPWLFEQVSNFLREKVCPPAPSIRSQRDIILTHLDTMYRFYGEHTGVRVARKHLTWYCRNLVNAENFRREVIRATSSIEQMQLTINFFDRYLAEQPTVAFNVSNLGGAACGEDNKKKVVH